MATRTGDIVSGVNPAHQLDLDALLRYASDNLPGFLRPLSNFKVSQFGHGQSNPTYLLEVVSGAALKRYVLRKKPPGKLLESAHAVDREFQFLDSDHRRNLGSYVKACKSDRAELLTYNQ